MISGNYKLGREKLSNAVLSSCNQRFRGRFLCTALTWAVNDIKRNSLVLMMQNVSHLWHRKTNHKYFQKREVTVVSLPHAATHK